MFLSAFCSFTGPPKSNAAGGGVVAVGTHSSISEKACGWVGLAPPLPPPNTQCMKIGVDSTFANDPSVADDSIAEQDFEKCLEKLRFSQQLNI